MVKEGKRGHQLWLPSSSSSETPTLLPVLCWCLLHPLKCPITGNVPLACCPFACSSELESDVTGDSWNSEVGEGQSWLPEPPACSSPIHRWASLIRSPVLPEDSPRTSKVADGKHCPDLRVQAALGETFPSGGCSLHVVFFGGFSAFLVL